MEPNQTKWINNVLNSVNGIERAEPNPFLYTKIRSRLASQPLGAVYVSTRAVWLAAASFVLLALLNWQLVGPSSASPRNTTASLSTVVSELNLYPTTPQLYDQ